MTTEFVETMKFSQNNWSWHSGTPIIEVLSVNSNNDDTIYNDTFVRSYRNYLKKLRNSVGSTFCALSQCGVIRYANDNQMQIITDTGYEYVNRANVFFMDRGYDVFTDSSEQTVLISKSATTAGTTNSSLPDQTVLVSVGDWMILLDPIVQAIENVNTKHLYDLPLFCRFCFDNGDYWVVEYVHNDKYYYFALSPSERKHIKVLNNRTSFPDFTTEFRLIVKWINKLYSIRANTKLLLCQNNYFIEHLRNCNFSCAISEAEPVSHSALLMSDSSFLDSYVEVLIADQIAYVKMTDLIVVQDVDRQTLDDIFNEPHVSSETILWNKRTIYLGGNQNYRIVQETISPVIKDNLLVSFPDIAVESYYLYYAVLRGLDRCLDRASAVPQPLTESLVPVIIVDSSTVSSKRKLTIMDDNKKSRMRTC
jgi:hypothetical protein